MPSLNYYKLIIIALIVAWAYWLCTVSTITSIIDAPSLFTDFRETEGEAVSDAYFDENSKFIRVNAIQNRVVAIPEGRNPNDYDAYQLNFKNYLLTYHMNSPMNKTFCEKSKVLVMISTRPDAFDTRSAVRASWLHNLSSEITYRFIVGFTSNATVRSNLKQESVEFDDLVFMDIVDSYNNLSLKTGALMQWQQKHCPHVDYLVKADDDIAIDLNRLLHFMRTDFDDIASVHNTAIFGLIWQKAVPNRDSKSKWFTPHTAWRKNYFPDYCNGPTYVLTSAAVEALLRVTTKAHIMNIEDVLYTGIIADFGKIQRFDRRKIFGHGRSLNNYHDCDNTGTPYISSLYDFKITSTYTPGKQNAISTAVDKLRNVKCY